MLALSFIDQVPILIHGNPRGYKNILQGDWRRAAVIKSRGEIRRWSITVIGGAESDIGLSSRILW